MPMRTGFGLRKIRQGHGRLVRAVAVFFLLFTCADLSMPEYFCDEEAGALPVNLTVRQKAGDVATGLDLAAAASTTEDALPGAPDSEAPHEEDCFCCCAHVLPAVLVANVGASDAKTPALVLTADSLPSPPLQSTYHPPRFA
jgi:hypothetical protein